MDGESGNLILDLECVVVRLQQMRDCVHQDLLGRVIDSDLPRLKKHLARLKAVRTQLTPEEWANKVRLHWCQTEYPVRVSMLPDLLENYRAIVSVIREVIAEEREACAKIAEEDAITGDWPPAAGTATRIRNRGS